MEIFVVEFFNSFGSSFVSSEVDKVKVMVFVFVRVGKGGGGDIVVFGEEFMEFFVGDFGGDVFDVDVGEVGFYFFKFVLVIFFGDVVVDIDFFFVEKYVVDVFDGVGGSFVGFVVNEIVIFGVVVFVLGDFVV